MGKPYDFSKNFNIRAGILGIFAAALLSYVLSSGLLIYSLRRAWQIYRGNERGESPLQAVSILFLFAVFSDMVQSFANILSARWAFNGKVTEGSYCNAQAILKQVGNDGVACFTIAIAVLTFLQVMSPNALGRYGAKYFVIGAIASTVLFIFLIITVPATIDHPYYGNTDLWCWILKAGQSTRRLRIASEYAVMWLAVVLSAILYGTIVINWLLDAVDSQLRRDAVKMLWYPITYTVVVAPQSIVRFLQFNNYNPPHGIVILTSVLFTSGGTFNSSPPTGLAIRFCILEITDVLL
ncbi:uncharacterized protein EI90DRAFT_1642206 [Cantharellus anzutake]|uniref:uncharacterized protein n=1 Tax=Cantharellus anzutake TaxID=1750568 RepID=UPI001902E38C|nr:uncharacterized protein EI90DRAFT_1642206 [Cantharellus anzutake]KAF8327921.1 hypothetical protein EI90DRAFT_1642206 [Cantharellus anzutake]